MGIQIGQLLVEQGVLSEKQVEHILNVQRRTRRPFGDLAERLYDIAPKAIEDAWVEQYVRTVGVVDLDTVQFDANCLRQINRRQAWQFQVLPANRDHMGLNAATDAEHLVRAANFASRRINEPVTLLVAPSDQLREFLMKHYPVPEYMADYASTLG